MIEGYHNEPEPQTSLYYELMVKHLGKKEAKRYWNRRDLFQKHRFKENEGFLSYKECQKLNKKFDKYLLTNHTWKTSNYNSWNNLSTH